VPQAHRGALFPCAYHALWGALLRLGCGTVAAFAGAGSEQGTPFLVLPYQGSGLKLHYGCQDEGLLLSLQQTMLKGSPGLPVLSSTSSLASGRAGLRVQGHSLLEAMMEYLEALLQSNREALD
jgi:hypothetical protein